MTTFETKADAVTEALKIAKSVGVAYAVKWPLGHWTVEARKPSFRNPQMQVIECDDAGATNLA